ncbi:MAG: acylneuraminate cytidylyltransferase family protein [Patescibacteria group bacterium]
MIKNKKIVALIPLRGGSKSIPYKNIKNLGGKPLAFWVCQAALESKYIDAVYVSTEDEKIKKTIENLKLPIKIIDRPENLATDVATDEAVLLHAIQEIKCDILIDLHATHPLTDASHLDSALEKFVKGGYDSMLTGVLFKNFYWTREGVPLNYNPLKRPMRQQWEGTVTENGAFYITTPDTLRTHGNFLGGKIGIYEMPKDIYVDIDEPSDWEKAEKMFALKKVTKND